MEGIKKEDSLEMFQIPWMLEPTTDSMGYRWPQCRLPSHTDYHGHALPLCPDCHCAHTDIIQSFVLHRVPCAQKHHTEMALYMYHAEAASCVDHHHTATVFSAHSVTYHSGEIRHEYKQAKNHPEYPYFVLNVGSFAVIMIPRMCYLFT